MTGVANVCWRKSSWPAARPKRTAVPIADLTRTTVYSIFLEVKAASPAPIHFVEMVSAHSPRTSVWPLLRWKVIAAFCTSAVLRIGFAKQSSPSLGTLRHVSRDAAATMVYSRYMRRSSVVSSLRLSIANMPMIL